jgi:hypothetical protein
MSIRHLDINIMLHVYAALSDCDDGCFQAEWQLVPDDRFQIVVKRAMWFL